jgi:hypothetical protein
MQRSSGIFGTNRIGQELVIKPKLTEKYTVVDIRHYRKFALAQNDINGPIIATYKDPTDTGPVAVTFLQRLGRPYFIVGYNMTPTLPQSGPSGSKINPPMTISGGKESLGIQAAELVKYPSKNAVVQILSEQTNSAIFNNSRTLQNSILQGLKDKNVPKNIVTTLAEYFESDLSKINISELPPNEQSQIRIYVGELIPGLAALRNKPALFNIDVLKGKKAREFIVPLDPGFKAVDSKITLSDGTDVPISSKAGVGASASFIANILEYAVQKNMSFPGTYFQELVQHKKNNMKLAGPRFPISLMNSLLGTNFEDPVKQVYEELLLQGQLAEEKSNDVKEAVEKAMNYDWNNLTSTTAPTRDTLLVNLPFSITACCARIISDKIMSEPKSVQAAEAVIGAKNFYQFNLQPFKPDLNGMSTVKFIATPTGKLKFKLTTGKGGTKLRMEQGVLNYFLTY